MAEQQKDDFEAAFAQFSAPEDQKKEEPAASAAPAEGEGGEGAAKEGGDAGSVDDAGTGAAGGSAAGDADGAGANDGAAGDAGAAKEGEAAAADAAKSGEGEAAKAEPAKEGDDGAGAATAGAEAKAEGPSADDILEGLKKLIGDGKAPEAEPAKVDEPKAEEKPLYTEDETEFLKEYDKEWGDVAKGESLRRRQEYQQLLGYVFQQVVDYVKPIKEMAEAVAERTHRQDIETNIVDYSDNLRDDVVKWAKTQPAYLQDAYNHVITQGTVEEVKDLVERYRAATGKKPAGATTEKPAGKKDNELSDEAKKAAASLAPVDVKRSGVQQPGDPSNFDDAWKQFATADQT